jgi:hypothetical protein
MSKSRWIPFVAQLILASSLTTGAAQDGVTCRPGTHCAPHPVNKPCTHCIPDEPQHSGMVFVSWDNFNGSEKASGAETGTRSNAYRTVRRAIKAARPGDTLSIRAGFYNEEETLVLDKAVRVRVENGPVTIYAHRTDDILTSADVPGSQPPIDLQTCQGGLYIQGSLVPNEWMQAPGGENLPAMGRVADKSEPNNDLIWDHPFGFDYWWSVALDDDRYLSLLNQPTLASTMDCSGEEDDVCKARDKAREETGRDPKGILHTEVEDRLLPQSFRPLPGDRVYMRGHRIADCGHQPVGAEMHPPTLVVAARIWPDDGSLRTTVMAMPYLTTQSYELGKDLPTALGAAITAASLSPIGIPTGFPIIARTSSKPFNVPIIAKYRVTVPSVPRRATVLNLHYHFVTRPGVTVTIAPVNGSEADIEIHMDPETYQPFRDADCDKRTVGLETFDAQWGKPKGTVRAAVNGIAGALGGIPGVLITANIGMQVAICQVPNGTPAVPFTTNDNAVVTDASQPFPVYGWLSYD